MWKELLIAGFLGSGTSVVVGAGETVALELDYQPVAIICDDATIIRVQADAGTIRITGMKPGETTCSFRKPGAVPGPLVTVRVLPR
jgi:hypothetical protein